MAVLAKVPVRITFSGWIDHTPPGQLPFARRGQPGLPENRRCRAPRSLSVIISPQQKHPAPALREAVRCGRYRKACNDFNGSPISRPVRLCFVGVDVDAREAFALEDTADHRAILVECGAGAVDRGRALGVPAAPLIPHALDDKVAASDAEEGRPVRPKRALDRLEKEPEVLAFMSKAPTGSYRPPGER
jgi:hypothetical protein